MEGSDAKDFYIRLFGQISLEVEGKDVPLNVKNRNDCALLLALLTLHANTRQFRRGIATVLWGDDSARNLGRVRNALSDLRTRLDTEAHRLETPKDWIRLSLGPKDADIIEFENAISHNHHADAVILYKGPLAPGRDAQWLTGTREHYKRNYFLARETLAAQLQQSNVDKALEHLREALKLDPARESTARMYMFFNVGAWTVTTLNRFYERLIKDARLAHGDPENGKPVLEDETVAAYDAVRGAIKNPHTRRSILGAQHPKGATDTAEKAVPNNLRDPLSTFIGRENELAEVAALLDTNRLLTITGSPGCGKTRLALEAASRAMAHFPDGVWMAHLGQMETASLVPQSVAEALRVKEQPDKGMQTTLIDHLKDKHLLLLLDNCEHLLTECRTLSHLLLRSCPGIKLIVTSRHVMKIPWEQPFRVLPLSLPDANGPVTVDSIMKSEAALLFVERALPTEPDFAVTEQNVTTLASICRRLDGIPLAIELAAARMSSLSIEQIETRLDDCFRLLTGGNEMELSHHDTLRACIDWSYRLLTVPEKIALIRLSVFAGGCTLDAAESVCSGEGGFDWASGSVIDETDVVYLLDSLVNKSLVAVEKEKETRYRLLESIRQYGQELLKTDGTELTRTREKHQAFYIALAVEAEPQLSGPNEAWCLLRLEREHDNFRTALEFSKKDAGLRLVGVLWLFWYHLGYLSEGRARLKSLLKGADAGAYPRVCAKALRGAGLLAYCQGDHVDARASYEKSLVLYRMSRDECGIAATLNGLGNILYTQSDYMAASASYEESLSLSQSVEDAQGIAASLHYLANVKLAQGDLNSAQSLYKRSLDIHRASDSASEIGTTLHQLGVISHLQGDNDGAKRYFEEGLQIRSGLRSNGGIANSLSGLASVALSQGNLVSAYALYTDCIARERQAGARGNVAEALVGLGVVEMYQGNYDSARALYGESLALQRELGDKRATASLFESFAALASIRHEPVRAARLWGAADALRVEIGALMTPPELLRYDRHVKESRSALSENVFAAAWLEGREMSLDAACTYALQDVKG